MTQPRSELQGLEGRKVCVALVDGSRIDDCQLVSIGRGRVDTLWVYTHTGDSFIPFTDVVDIWPTTSSGRHAA
jgi:hypothetical protein